LVRRIRWFTPFLVSIFALFLFPHPIAASSPVGLLISNVRDTSFTVSWLTGAGEGGQVQVLGGRTYNDDRGASSASTIHYVTVTGLQPNTLYQFDLVSGSGKYDNDGAHYAVLTGATLLPPTPDLILGQVQNQDGSKATEAIVFFSVYQEQSVSSPLSMLLTERDDGYFHVNLSDARVQNDPNHLFTYGSATDALTIQAVNAQATGSLRVPVSDPRLRTTDPTKTVVITLNSGAQTPTLIVRQPTPTPIPPEAPVSTDSLVLSIGAAAVIFIGILLVAIQFIWRRS
jgi:hypothetical protein